MSGRPGLLLERLNRLADRVFVGCTVEYEAPGTLVVPGLAVRLREVSPGRRVSLGDDAGCQRPAPDLATIAGKQPRIAGLRPLMILLPEEVSGQIAETEMAGHQTRVAPCWRVAVTGFKLGDQFVRGRPGGHGARRRR